MTLRQVLPALVLALCAPDLFLAGTESPERRPRSDPEEPAENRWERDPAIRGMFTVSYTYASDSAGPSTRGFRIGYGYSGGPADDYPWGEFWATFRENGSYDIMAAGLSAVPVSMFHERLGLGFLVDLGVSRRRERSRSVFAGMIGAGVEGFVRISRRWDFVSTAEAVYRTTSDIEFQARAGVRFHHEKIPPIRDGP